MNAVSRIEELQACPLENDSGAATGPLLHSGFVQWG
jgi:hypothetical protein